MVSRSRFAQIGLGIVIIAALMGAFFALLRPQNTAVANATPRTAFVHLFEWKWSDVEQECVNFLGPKGFSAVQVSPPNEHIDHKQVTDFAWWARYQPVSYQLESRSGTRQEFISMVNTCQQHGVDIYVDAIINHMADQVGVGVNGSTFNRASLSYPTYSSNDFNFCNPANIQGSDYSNNAWRVRHCQLSGLPDLNQGSPYVRGQIQAYLQDLVNIGVAGFRVDAAKHMNVADINAIFGGVNGDYYVFLEVIDPGGQSIGSGEYTPYFDVTEFKYSQKIGETFASGQLSWLSNFGEAWGFMGTTDAVVFVDNHDNQRGHGMAADVTHRSGALYDLANVYMLAWPYGYPKVMSSYEWGGVNDSQGPPHDGQGNTKSVYNNDGTLNCFANEWKCEHRWLPIANMVAFRNYAAAAQAFNVTNWWSNGGNQIAFTRSGANGGAGFVVINRQGNNISNQTFQTGMAPGTYCNITAGNFENGQCSGPTVTVGSGGWATVSVNAMSALAIHGGAIVGVTPTPTPVPGGSTVTFTVNGFVTQPGQDMFVVGNVPELGNWNTANAVPLTWQSSSTWSGPVVFTTSAGQTVQFKFIVKQGGSVIWQGGGNRSTAVPSSGSSSVNINW